MPSSGYGIGDLLLNERSDREAVLAVEAAANTATEWRGATKSPRTTRVTGARE